MHSFHCPQRDHTGPLFIQWLLLIDQAINQLKQTN
jgi:hypothetical protein